ncbi:MAG: nicotinate-nucleotide--dimethylbenzimidazole phosphoribosyltransferase [Bacillota bacterium]|nr:nicotinate-nucleotide--dimethylbenzimidazole phosphoribosyltransferase [Bacillota bacterium]
MELQELCSRITAPAEQAAAAAKQQWDSVAKPLGSLGLLEEAVIRIAALCGEKKISTRPRAVLVFCADNGVVQEGISQSSSEVTALVAGNIVKGEASVCHMAALADAKVLAIDMGMKEAVPGCLNRRIAAGTGNIAREPAMSREQAEAAILCGAELVRELKAQGYRLLATGEMGIGNTTSSSAVASALLGLEPALLTGRGAGLSDSGLKRKIAVVEQALSVNRPDPEDPLDVLAKLGGFDIAAMCGVFLGGAAYQLPILMDGLISCVSALLAYRLCPRSKKAMLASHCSAEPAARLLLESLELSAPIQADLRLGEGSGAVCLMPLLDMALSVYGEMSTFEQIGLAAYRHLEGNP